MAETTMASTGLFLPVSLLLQSLCPGPTPYCPSSSHKSPVKKEEDFPAVTGLKREQGPPRPPWQAGDEVRHGLQLSGPGSSETQFP